MGTFIGTGPDRQWVSEIPGSLPVPAPMIRDCESSLDGHRCHRHEHHLTLHWHECPDGTVREWRGFPRT